MSLCSLRDVTKHVLIVIASRHRFSCAHTAPHTFPSENKSLAWGASRSDITVVSIVDSWMIHDACLMLFGG